VLVDVLLVIGNERLGNSLPDGIDLGGMTTTIDTDPDIDIGKLFGSNNKDRFVNLESEDLWFDQVEGRPVHLDEPRPALQWATAVAVFFLPKH